MDQTQRWAPRGPAWPVILTTALMGVFATGVAGRPPGAAWDRAYDVVLYNLPYLSAALACFLAARRAHLERFAWAGLGTALVLSAVGNALRVISAGLDGTGPSTPLADSISLAGYVTMYVCVIGLIRARVPRFHPSMWLDGLIGALGSLAVGVTFLLGPYLNPAPGHERVTASELVGPTTGLLLLAVLVAVGGILGVRLDRTMLTAFTALTCLCLSEFALFVYRVEGTYKDGGPLELGWLTSVVLCSVAATMARDRQAPEDGGATSRIGWRLLAVPMVCTLSSLVVLGWGWTRTMPPVAAWLAIACVVAGVVRVSLTFREVGTFYEVKAEARTDELTGLPNRRALLERAQQAVGSAGGGGSAALLLLDLDGFKEVNDSLGHAAGDDLLRQVGPRLRSDLRARDLLARLGGDEFAVLLPDTSADEALLLADRLREQVLQPFVVEDVRLHVGVSIGIATCPAPATSVQDLLRSADVAMYTAKTTRQGVHLYRPDPATGSGGDRLRTMEELRVALTDDQLVVHLQPQISLTDGTVVGAEALVRWDHPTRGLLSPADLLPAAEQAGLLGPLTDAVLELALAAATEWWPDRRVPVSVNLSAASVTDLDLTDKVGAALGRHGLPPEALTLELVEDTLMADPERGQAALADLRRLGVRTSIDDYGTGYSSLAYLRQLPADELKLDRRLTADVDRDRRAASIVAHTVSLAHDLGLSLVAEGVEDAATRAVLRDLGCDVAQGWAIARPMPVEDFLRWLADAVVPILHR